MANTSPFLPSTHCRNFLAKAIIIFFLCSFFYILGIYTNSRSLSKTPFLHPNCLHLNFSTPRLPSLLLDFESRHSASLLPNSSANLPLLSFCPQNYTDYCPCQDPDRMMTFALEEAFYKERHCPRRGEVLRCRIPRPIGYRAPFRWPESRDFAWFANVPSKKLSVFKANQNWVRLEGDRLVFPGGGTTFRAGVKGYVDQIGRMIPLRKGSLRTVLDLGCGVASFGAHLLDYDILTMSIAPRDGHEAQVQFALERGLPAMLGVLSTHRLPIPAGSFDMAHCSRCLIQWTADDGKYLMEIDRVLRPGGYWILSGPPVNWRNSNKGSNMSKDMERNQIEIEDLARRLCWKKIADRDPIAVWQKPTNHLHCLQKKSKLKEFPSFCRTTDHDAAWYKKMEKCVTPLPAVTSVKHIAGGALERWPKRLTFVPPRILSGRIPGITPKMFLEDNSLWKRRVFHYEMILGSLSEGKYRNIMDMNTGLGGFAAALSKYPTWVMNVVPVDSRNDTLGIIYERGLIGTYMDWCEAFSTYPRTYDLIHANGILTMYMNKCDILDILLEMDRILRPEGAVIIRDHVDVIGRANAIAERMNWQTRISHSEHGSFHPEKILLLGNSVQASANQIRRNH